VFSVTLQKVRGSAGLPQERHAASCSDGTKGYLLLQCQSPVTGAVPTGFAHHGVLEAVRNTQVVAGSLQNATQKKGGEGGE